MVGVRQVDLNLMPLKKLIQIKQDIVSDKDNYTAVLVTATKPWMLFCPIWNKVYHTRIVKENNIHFMESTNINDDRIFNLEYAGYAKSVALISYIGYNWVVNPNSITNSPVKPSTFLHTGLELDHVLKKEMLGKEMQKYTAYFVTKFLIRAIIEEFRYPTPNKWNEVKHGFKVYFRSCAFKKYGIKTFYWGISYIIDALKRIYVKI